MSKKMGQLLSETLRKRRLELGLTQKQVADVLGYKSQFVTNWERGASSPPAYVVPKLAALLEISEKTMLQILVKDSAAYWQDVFQTSKKRKAKKTA